MAVIKCKMCGGDLDISEGLSVCECEYCGTKQTVPSADSEKKLTLFARANRLRLANEFDKAAGVYETIVADFPEEAEAYWGLVLCRYGIEYVDDPATGKKVPTCHRVSFDSVMEDTDFDQACENADAIARRQYREEAKQIEDIRRGIIEVSGKEAPYDVFICYKETDENGDRTVDSVIAQDVYDALMERGYRVFFSRISLEDKLGTEYEPYIFAALNSAKIMLAFGTDYEYYNAVWVKNEWSRFLKLMEKDKSKHLIPCYKGIDAYDMPKEFHRLQGQDMGKVGAMQDLLRGIEKILPRKEAAPLPIVQQVVQTGGPNTAALLQRGNMALEDGDWDKAKEFFDQVLDMDAQSAEAYLGLAIAGMKLSGAEKIGTLDEDEEIKELSDCAPFQKFLRFASSEERTHVDDLLERAKAEAAARRARVQKEAAERAERERREAAERAKRLAAFRERIAPVQHIIAAGYTHTIGLRADGTVVAVGSNLNGRCNVSGWRDIVAVAGSHQTVGLRSDGTVVAAGINSEGQCNVGGWRDIVAIAAGQNHTVGVHADGTVVTAGDNKNGQCNVSGWRDIVAVAAGREHTVGLRRDGTVVAAGSDYDGCCNVSKWRGIEAIAAGACHTVGLRADGTVIATGSNSARECAVSDWQDIATIAACYNTTVGIRSDGTVVVSKIKKGLDASSWRNIVAVTVGYFHIIGLRSDGTVVYTGVTDDGRCNVSNWKFFNSIDTLEQERREIEKKELIKREHLRVELNKEQAALKTELGNLKGLFSGKRRKEIEARLAEIEAELKKL